MSDAPSKVRYDVENTVQRKLKLNKNTDADIIDHLSRQPNVQGYIKALIRADIENDRKTKDSCISSLKKAYPALFHYEDGGYWAEFPDLPGCFAQGDTIDGVFFNASGALTLHLRSVLDDGTPLPEPSDIRSYSVDNGFTSLVIVDI